MQTTEKMGKVALGNTAQSLCGIAFTGLFFLRITEMYQTSACNCWENRV
nr:hypothetical protein [uncultured Ruminococcus sp.]